MTFYDREGEEVTLEEWAALFEDKDYRRIGLYEDKRHVVSTVWLGVDSHENFETMVFEIVNGEVDFGGVYSERYASAEQAEAGHERIVEEWKKSRIGK